MKRSGVESEERNGQLGTLGIGADGAGIQYWIYQVKLPYRTTESTSVSSLNWNTCCLPRLGLQTFRITPYPFHTSQLHTIHGSPRYFSYYGDLGYLAWVKTPYFSYILYTMSFAKLHSEPCTACGWTYLHTRSKVYTRSFTFKIASIRRPTRHIILLVLGPILLVNTSA
jgi:hypothetical protein